LSPEKLAEYRDAFDSVDTDRNGFITLEELGTVMHNLGSYPSIPELRAMIREVDRDGDGKLSFSEYCALMGKRSYSESSLVRMFKAVHDKDGKIGAKELKTLMEEITNKPFAMEEVEEMMRLADTNGDGRLDFTEMSNMLNSI